MVYKVVMDLINNRNAGLGICNIAPEFDTKEPEKMIHLQIPHILSETNSI